MPDYHEPRTLSPQMIALAVFLLGISLWPVVVPGDVSRRNDLIAAGVGLSLLLFLLWFGSSRWGSEFKSITVDERGLTVGRATLPPEAVGRTWVVPRARAFSARPRGRFEDLRIAYSSFGWLGTADDAVVVEDRSAEEPSCWLIASRDPQAVDAALAQLRRR